MWRKNFVFPRYQEEAVTDPPPGGGGDPPTDPPKGGDPPPGSTLSVDSLPEELRGLPEAEVKFHLQQMVAGLKTGNTRRKELEEEIAGLRKPAEIVKPAEPEKPLEEMILEDPEGAILSVLERTGLVDRFTRVEAQAGESVVLAVASSMGGTFEEHEEDVRKILKDTNVPRTKENVQGALEMVVGRKAIEKQQRDVRATANAILPTDDPPPDSSKLPELSGLEKEIQESSGMTPEEWHKNKAPLEGIKVATS